VIHRADALRVARGDHIDMAGVLAHVGLEDLELRARAQRLGTLDRVGLDQEGKIEARAVELVRAPAQEARLADRRRQDRAERHRLEHAWLARDARAPARDVLDEAALGAARPEKGRMRVDLGGEQHVTRARRLDQPRFLGRILEAQDAAHSWLMPPSATISLPSRKEESELARNSAVFAISSGVPKRFMGT
jgi:hypothetical protein